MKFNKNLIDFCIETLRKNDIAVIIGCEIEGTVNSKKRHSAIYDTGIKGDFYQSDGEKFVIPKGKFLVVTEAKKND